MWRVRARLISICKLLFSISISISISLRKLGTLKSWLKTWGPDHCQHSPQQPCEIFFPPTHPLGLRSFNNAARGAHV